MIASDPPLPEAARWVVLGRGDDGGAEAAFLNASSAEVGRTTLLRQGLGPWVARVEATLAVRWVWNDTPGWYAGLLADGVRVSRGHDLRLCHAILRDSALVAPDAGIRAHTAWDAAAEPAPAAPALFELTPAAGATQLPGTLDDALAEFARQHAAIMRSQDPQRLRLLAAAESAGALVAAELHAAGVPWDTATHERILDDVLGRRPSGGGVPDKLADAARRVTAALGDPQVNLDSAPKLLRALHRAGIPVETTSRWELTEHRHPVIEPLLEYKKLSRLISANGWAWLAEWVYDGRFRPVYVPGGVVTGRWASSGGGALQLPRQLRPAVRADPGWRLIIADVAQLEPRVLAAMAADRALADAARGKDLYAGVVGTGAVATRSEAKGAMLGAMYGATMGESGRLVPRLRRAFPKAMALVDDAAREGERGDVVTTWLGRSCPAPSALWRDAQSAASETGARPAEESRARRAARDRGRFTRNFIVQGTAAEWALAWLADLRVRLAELEPVGQDEAAPRSGPVFARRPHLAFFLHDEVVVHAPAARAEAAAQAVQDAAAAAGRLLFGDFPIDFPLELRIAEDADKA